MSMKEMTIFNGLLIGWSVLGLMVFVALFFVAAPYGRHTRKGWGYTFGEKLGWVIMEAPAPIVFAVCFFTGSNALTAAPLVFLFLWQMHYLHRAFIYPFSLRGNTRRMPVSVVGFGLVFNLMNGYLNGRYISELTSTCMLAASSRRRAKSYPFIFTSTGSPSGATLCITTSAPLTTPISIIRRRIPFLPPTLTILPFSRGCISLSGLMDIPQHLLR